MSHNTTNADAQEFGLHVKQGGWRLGLLVARNVEKGQRGGDTTISRSGNAKAPAYVFAEEAGVGKNRILRYLEAWNRAAEAGHVPHGNTLTPGQEIDLDVETLPDWSKFYDAATTHSKIAEDRCKALNERPTLRRSA